MTNQTYLLYVDDEMINRCLFEMNFGKKYALYTAASGSEGLELLRLHSEISVVLSDLKMPGMDGLEFLGKAKRSHPEKLYFVLTASEKTPEISSVMEQGLVQAYFRKPLNIRAIQAEIEEQLAKSN